MKKKLNKLKKFRIVLGLQKICKVPEYPSPVLHCHVTFVNVKSK